MTFVDWYMCDSDIYCYNWYKIKVRIKVFLLFVPCGHFLSVGLFAAVSPSASSYNETLSTLRYAAHARNIVNKPRVNEVSGSLQAF